MMRSASFTWCFALISATAVFAQPSAALCYSPDRFGWAGPSVELGCLPCCGCRSAAYGMEWQQRPEDAGFSGPVSFINGRYTSSAFTSLSHLERYCYRMRFVDDAGPGQWGPSSTSMCSSTGNDVCFTWDSVPPTSPQLLDGGVIAGSNRVELRFAPSSDDGGGVARYVFRYLPGGAPAAGSFGTAADSPVSDVLGAGTWTVALFAEDRALNVSPNSAPFTVTLGFDASVQSPLAPNWPVSVTSADYVDLQWPDDGAQSWVVTQRSLDGGWFIPSRPRVSGLSALLNVGSVCRRHAARIARVVGDQVSDWSLPSPDLLVDNVAPIAFTPQLIDFDGGAALINWAVATDACFSGISYSLERSVNGAPFVVRTSTASTQFADAMTEPGTISWRVTAIDGAGNRGTSGVGAVLVVAPADAGMPLADAGQVQDAGAPDSGVDSPEDAGATEPPSRRIATVGCGCEPGGAGSSALLLLALAFSQARFGTAAHTRRPR